MSIWNVVDGILEDFLAEIRSLPVAPETNPVALRSELSTRYDFEGPVPLERLTRQLAELLRDHGVQVTHPRYFGLFNPSTPLAGAVADALVAAFNPQLAAWSHAPAAQELERLTLARLARCLGFEKSLISSFTSGGAEANLSAVLAALAHACPTWDVGGLWGSRRPCLYVSSETHHSFVKVARFVGLGTEAVRTVALGPAGTLSPEALQARIDADRRAGLLPLMVIGTLGTTGAGLVDPLPALAALARQNGLWFHVDAAWGGACCLLPELAHLCDGVPEADSVTWDAHKWLSAPMGAGMFFCRHPEAVRRAFAVTTSYMPSPEAPDLEDPYATTPQWSRRAIGLKVFLALAESGLDGWRARIRHQVAMGDRLRTRLIDSGWTVVNDTPLPLVCATHADLRSGRTSAAAVAARVVGRGRAWVSPVSLAGEAVVRACITSFLTTAEDVEVLVEELERARTAAGPVERPERAPRIALVTCAALPRGAPDDGVLAERLRARGARVQWAVWSDESLDWSGFDGIVLRSTWDYHLDPGRFRAWLEGLAAAGAPVWNPVEQLLANMDKVYLTALAERGVPLLPTECVARGSSERLDDLLVRRGWKDVVVKPTVSANAWGTLRIRQPGAAESDAFARSLERGDLLVQPFAPEIVSHGEWSLCFLAGEFSHAVVKRPAPGDFRSQETWGGAHARAIAEPGVLAQARSILELVQPTPLYARVDGFVRDGALVLMELELIEPSLYMDGDQAVAARFAEVILAAVRHRRRR